MYGYFKIWFGPVIATWLFGIWVTLLIFLVFLCMTEAPAKFRYLDL